MTDAFERVWYGEATVESADFEAFAADRTEASRLLERAAAAAVPR